MSAGASTSTAAHSEEDTAHQDSAEKEEKAGTSVAVDAAATTTAKDNDTSDLEASFSKVTLEDKDQNDGTEKKVAKEKHTPKKGNHQDSKKPGPVLAEPTIEAVADYIKSGKCRKVIFMVGAGISTSAGIPDFRSPDTGLFSQLEKYNLPYPEAIFDIGFFQKNPKPFFHLARELFPGNFDPTPCHYFMRLLHDKGQLLRLYTQNIDSLERIAGVPDEKLLEAHGTFNTAHCTNKRCRKAYSLEWMKKIVLPKDRKDNVARCDSCGSYVKPDIIFYGEMLPDRFYSLIEHDFPQCDLLIVMGTSLTVQPFASLVDMVGGSVPRLLINLTEPEGGGNLLSKFIPGLAGGSSFNFKSKSNVRNVFLRSDADSGCRKLAQLLGWEDDLQKLIERKSTNKGGQ